MQSSSRDILLFSTADWDNPFWTNKQHMAALFADKRYRVLYIDSLGLRRPALQRQDLHRICRRLRKALPIAIKVRPNLWRASPLVFPWHSSPLVRWCNDFILQTTIRWHMHYLNMKKPIIWTYNPVIAKLCSTLPHQAVVYHCVDDLSASPQIDSNIIQHAEEKLAGLTDICFTTSHALTQKMSQLFTQVVYEPNVCDYEFFSTARNTPPQPLELQHIPHPRLLFIGALSEYKVDFALMERLGKRLPNIHWVLIGSVGEGQPGSRGPSALPNIHTLGPVPYARLPEFMAHCDAAVMPMRSNAYTEAMFPMKFFESLAAGLPVICTRLPALADFESLYFPADSEDEFQGMIQSVLAGKRRDQHTIDDMCKKHSWAARLARMEDALAPFLAPPIHTPNEPAVFL